MNSRLVFKIVPVLTAALAAAVLIADLPLPARAAPPMESMVKSDERLQIVPPGAGIEIDPTNEAQRKKYGLDDHLTLHLRDALNVVTMMDNGPVENRVDLVFVGDGYTEADLPTYAIHIGDAVADIFAEEPFGAYASYFNVHRVEVISNESGVDVPDQGIYKDTALDMAFGSGSNHLFVSIGKAKDAAAYAPDEDQILACANSTLYGGSGYYSSDVGTFPGGNGLASEVALHEFGHSFGNLADEYVSSSDPYTGGEPYFANVSIYDAAAQASLLKKWYRWLDLPNVDTFEGAYYKATGIYRPTLSSKMRSLSRPFEEVNVEQFIRLIYTTVSPIDDATPPTATWYVAGTTFFVTPMQPADHNLDIQWFIDDVPVAGATGVNFTPDYEALSDTLHTVSVSVVDNTTRVRDENIRASLMTESRAWPVMGGYPGFPTGLVATADSDSVYLDWNDNPEPDIAYYNVYRATTAGGPYTLIDDSLTSDYDDTNVVAATTYYYVVTAYAQGDESDYSNEDLGTPGVPMPIAPQNVSVTAGEYELQLDWDDNPEPGILGYKVFRSEVSGGPYELIHTGLVEDSEYLDGGLVVGNTYYYVLLARDSGGNEGALSAEVSGVPIDLPPAAPTGLIATPHNQSVVLTWNPNSEPDFNSYFVYVSLTPGGPYDEVDNDDTTTFPVYGLQNGTTYYFVIAAEDRGTNMSPYSNEASATPFDDQAPAAPENLTATIGDGFVSLDWDDNTEPDLGEYRVYRSTTSGGPYTQVEADSPSDYYDTNVTNEVTYYYVVTAADLSMNESEYSEEVAATPTNDPPPSAPTNLVATAGYGFVALDWDDNPEPDIQTYRIYRATVSGGPYTEIDNDDPSEFVDNSVVNGTWYYYVVTAVDLGNKESGYSNQVSARPGDVVAPAAPTGLVAYPMAGGAYLDWDDNSEPDLQSYRVYIAPTSGGPYDEVDSDDPSEWLMSGLTNGTTYYFVVTAIDSWYNESAFSNEASATPSADPAPIPPRNLSATAGPGIVSLDWSNAWEQDVQYYKVYRATTSGGPYAYIDEVDVSESEFDDTSVVNFTTYYYVVTAVDTMEQESAYSSEVSATPLAPVPPPDNVQASAGPNRVSLWWDRVNHPDVEGYGIYRATVSGGPYQSAGSTQSEAFTDYNVDAGTTYYYVVVSIYNHQEESAYSNEVYATPFDTIPPAAPTNLIGTPTDGGAMLSWDANSEPDLMEYVIYRGTTSGGPYTEVDRDDATSYGDGGLTNGVTYYYVVTAVDTSNNESGYSNQVAVTPADSNPPAAPTNLVGTPTDGGAMLSWDANSEPDFMEYVIYRGTTSGGPYTEIDRDDAASYGDGGLINGVTYYYVVTAVDTSNNESGYSNQAAVTPEGATSFGYRTQSGREQITSSLLDVSIDPVDPSRAFVLLSYGTGYYNGNTNTNQVMVRGDLLDADTLRLYRGDSGNSTWVSWQVIECVGEEFEVFRGAGTFTNGQSDASIGIGATVAPANCMAIVTADSNSASLSYYNQAHLTAYVNSATTVRVQRSASANSTVNYNWSVVEFDPAKIASIQHGSLTFSSPREYSPATAAISAVDLDTSLLVFQSRSTNNGLAYQAIAGRLGSSTSVEFYQHTGSSGTRTVEYYVIDFGAGASAQRGQVNYSSNKNWYTADVAHAPVDMGAAVHFHSMTCDGTGTAFPRSYSTAEFTSDSNLRIERKRKGQASYIEWQVIELPPATE